MKQNVLDRNAWLAGSLLRPKRKGTRQEQPGNERAEMWLCMKKQIFLNILKKQIGKRKKICCANICSCVFQNKLQLSLRYLQSAV